MRWRVVGGHARTGRHSGATATSRAIAPCAWNVGFSELEGLVAGVTGTVEADIAFLRRAQTPATDRPDEGATQAIGSNETRIASGLPCVSLIA